MCAYVFECAWDRRLHIPELLMSTLMWWHGTYAMEQFGVSRCRSKYMVGLGCILDCDER